MQHAFTVRSRETRAKLAGNLNRFIRWKTSDPVNTTISKNGLATCMGPTAAPVKITASVSDDYGDFSGSAELSCE